MNGMKGRIMSKVIFKLTFKHPNFKSTKSKNVAHLKYIATRPGVDKTVTESDLIKELEKGIEAIRETQTILHDDESNNDKYLKYIDERPKSHGLFGQEGAEDINKVQEELSKCDSFVWRGIISLREEDAKALGYLSKDKWQDFLRKKMPDVTNEMGIRMTNARWVAAVHMEKGHPHVHFMLWEKVPEKIIGTVSKNTLNKIRKNLTDEVFEDERLNIINEKNAMRDLIKELAKDDIGKAVRIIKDVGQNSVEIRSIAKETNQEGVAPKLYGEEENDLINKIRNLSGMMPGKGRVMLKFMPEDVKKEVRDIADYILSKPDFAASLEKNLKAAEELARMYTNKEEDIKAARDNSYNDIRDRVCQIILKGAAESLRENNIYVDNDLSKNFVEFIKNLNNKINDMPEKIAVLNKMAMSLYETNHTYEKIINVLSDFSEKQGLNLKQEDIFNIVKNVKDIGATSQDDIFSSPKKINFIMSNLKLCGYTEKEAYEKIKDAIRKETNEFENYIKNLHRDGFFDYDNGSYKLTSKGIEEFLNTKTFDKIQKSILKQLEGGQRTLSELIDNKDVYNNLIKKDPEEFKVGKFDLKIKDLFGDDNKITLKEIEEAVYKKYNDADIDKIEKEYNIYLKRIEKLCLNGYIEIDKNTSTYSFTQEGLNALKNLNERMEISKFDANVVLKYIDNVENGVLNDVKLKEMVYCDIANKKADSYYEKFIDVIESKEYSDYINVDNNGNVTITDEGNKLSFELQKVIKYFNNSNGQLTDEKLKELINKECRDPFLSDKKFKQVLSDIHELIDKDYIVRLKNGSYLIDNSLQDICNLSYHVYKEGGSIRKDELREVLYKNIHNEDAENHYKYIIRRLEFLKKEGIVSGDKGEYKITSYGAVKRDEILTPQIKYLWKELQFLIKLGLVKEIEKGTFVTTDKYKGIPRTNPVTNSEFNQTLNKLIISSYGNIDINKLERASQRIAANKYINGEYEKLPVNYEKLRESCGVEDTVKKTLKNISTALLVSGVEINEVKQIMLSWNDRSLSNLDPDMIVKDINETAQKVEDDRKFGRVTVISKSDWDRMFKDLGVDALQWIYKSLNWKEFNSSGMGLYSIINSIWKSTWSELERERLQTEAQAEAMKRNMSRQRASENKSARKEIAKKLKDKGSFSSEIEQ